MKEKSAILRVIVRAVYVKNAEKQKHHLLSRKGPEQKDKTLHLGV